MRIAHWAVFEDHGFVTFTVCGEVSAFALFFSREQAIKIINTFGKIDEDNPKARCDFEQWDLPQVSDDEPIIFEGADVAKAMSIFVRSSFKNSFCSYRTDMSRIILFHENFSDRLVVGYTDNIGENFIATFHNKQQATTFFTEFFSVGRNWGRITLEECLAAAEKLKVESERPTETVGGKAAAVVNGHIVLVKNTAYVGR